MMNQSYVINRLNVWSLDRIRREDSGIGWPKKLPGYDGMPIGNGGTIYAPNISEEIFETDKCVCALRVVDEMYYEIIYLTYVFRTVSAEQRLKRLGWKDQSTYHRNLHKAHAKVYDFMLDLSAGFALPTHKKPNANFYSRVTRTSTVG